jgi:2-amino-4-hydroxy-6-hydroxymethyldihydropteridine diphosphokinase
MQKKERLYRYVISIGSNAPDALERMHEAIRLLKFQFQDSLFSDIIKTQGIDVDIDCFFENAVAIIKTEKTPDEFKILLKKIEKQMGRSSHLLFVLIDMDIIIVNDHIIHSDYMKRKYIRDLLYTIIKDNNLSFQLKNNEI